MSNVRISNMINIFIVGIMSSILITMMLYLLLAQIINSTVIGVLDDLSILYLLIFGLEIIALICSIIVSFWIADNIKGSSVYRASILAFLCNLVSLLIISYGSLYLKYPEIFSELNGPEIFLVFPQVIVYFGIYILGHPIFIFIFSNIVYFLFFVVFLNQFYAIERKYNNKYNYEW